MIAVSKQVRASVLDLSGNVEKARDAPEALSKAELVEKAKQEGLAALKIFQAERQKALDEARGVSKDAGKGNEGDRDRDKDRGLELSKSKDPPTRPRGDPGDGHGL